MAPWMTLGSGPTSTAARPAITTGSGCRIRRACQKAKAAGITHIRFLPSPAEELSLPGESFDLVAIGNAFHRMPRAEVAARVLRWLRPGRFLALLWSGTPW